MRTKWIAAVLALSAAAAATAQSPPGTGAGVNASEPRVAQSRAISMKFAGDLRAALEAALAERGPVGAIEVCKAQAPAIAAGLSTQHGVVVKRTGLRVRNPSNSPEPWQSAALKDFEAQLGRGRRAEELEVFEARADGSARYLKAIAVQPLCLTCHGENIAPEVLKALQKQYPSDRATGFKLGDLRGAFSVEWPAEARPESVNQ